MTLKQTLIVLDRKTKTDKTFRESMVDGTISDDDLKFLLDPQTFTISTGRYYPGKPVSDENHNKLDALRDFVLTIGPLLSSEVLHQLTDRLITLAPACDKNNFMRTSTLEKSFLAFEMAWSPQMAEKHFLESERMQQEFPKENDIPNLRKIILPPNIKFFQESTPQESFQKPAPKEISQKPSPEQEKLIALCTEYKIHLEKSIGINKLNEKTQPDIKHIPPNLNLAIKKYFIVNQMLSKLNESSIASKQRIENMHAILNAENKTILKNRRDSSAGAKFLENILHLITLGLYSKKTKNTFAFWKSHGEALVDKMENQLRYHNTP